MFSVLAGFCTKPGSTILHIFFKVLPTGIDLGIEKSVLSFLFEYLPQTKKYQTHARTESHGSWQGCTVRPPKAVPQLDDLLQLICMSMSGIEIDNMDWRTMFHIWQTNKDKIVKFCLLLG
jgi:hypothetical protein